MSPGKIMVTGSRHWADKDLVFRALAAVLDSRFSGRDDVILIHGDCPTGADKMADEIWRSVNYPVLTVPARWDRYGKQAGPLRNKYMVDLEPDVVVAFIRPESRGTRNAVRLAEEAGIGVEAYYAS